ncbi:MAG: alkanesulfonate monooxygenase SsuD [Gammaproteobacteria bacterium]|jgi:alkanesulfonate monooxygenase SsuD/methylene tetrahydromethanopterin reductase-like flavin-dependent oxidoreductase (luciferase family)
MDYGIFSMPLHHPSREWRTVLEEDREMMILADKLGYSEAWIGEHVASTAEPIVSPLMFLASVAAQTKSIRFGTGVVNLPHHHPALLAGEIAMLDQLSGGRVMLGIGPGSLRSDAELFGDHDGGRRARMMMESIDTMIKLWTEDPPYNFDTEFWPVSMSKSLLLEYGVGKPGKPLQKPHPPIAITLRSPQSASAELAAQRGWIPISGNFVPSSHIAGHWPGYAAVRDKLNLPADPSIWRVARSIVITETDEEAREYVHREDGGMRFYFTYLFTLASIRGQDNVTLTDESRAQVAEKVEDALENMVISGSAQTVLDKLIALRDEIGHFGTLLATGHDWDDAVLWKSALRRLAEDVMPRFSQHADADLASSRAAE